MGVCDFIVNRRTACSACWVHKRAKGMFEPLGVPYGNDLEVQGLTYICMQVSYPLTAWRNVLLGKQRHLQGERHRLRALLSHIFTPRAKLGLTEKTRRETPKRRCAYGRRGHNVRFCEHA